MQTILRCDLTNGFSKIPDILLRYTKQIWSGELLSYVVDMDTYHYTQAHRM